MKPTNQDSFLFKSITVARARELFQNYHSRLAPVIKTEQNKVFRKNDYEPTEYAWIPLDELKQYIAFLDNIAKKNGETVSGVTFNFGAYNETDDFSNEASDMARVGDYKGRESIFLTPTFIENGKDKNELANHKPFYIEPDNASADPYKGTFKELDYNANNGTNEVSVSANELHTTPPNP